MRFLKTRGLFFLSGLPSFSLFAQKDDIPKAGTCPKKLAPGYYGISLNEASQNKIS